MRWVLAPRTQTVVELGAGTGALTRSLLDLGLDVIAVELDPLMREVLAERASHADLRSGSAEDIPVHDAEADTVVGAQMWHWVETDRATTEVARVLRPGGTLGLLWNLRDESVPWMAELGNLMGGEDKQGRPGRDLLPPLAPFSSRASKTFAFVQELSASDLPDFVDSRSHVQMLGPDDRSVLLERVRRFVTTHPDLAGRQTIQVPYVTACWRAVRA